VDIWRTTSKKAHIDALESGSFLDLISRALDDRSDTTIDLVKLRGERIPKRLAFQP
jgi:hypothetical protein